MDHYDENTARLLSSSGHRSPHPVPPPVRRAMKQTAEAVETWRKLRGLTQAQLADRAGVGRRTIIRLESGDGGVTIENLLRVLRALGLLDARVRTRSASPAR